MDSADEREPCRHLRLRNDREELPAALEWIRSFIAEAGLGGDAAYALELAVDELVLNVMSYAYPEGTEGEVELRLWRGADGGARLRIEDRGAAFDPTAREDPQIDASLDERRVGGLGVYLVKRLARSMEYRREGDRNVLEVAV
jgi:serine/threonine-protein kinase RsbW